MNKLKFVLLWATWSWIYSIFIFVLGMIFNNQTLMFHSNVNLIIALSLLLTMSVYISYDKFLKWKSWNSPKTSHLRWYTDSVRHRRISA